MVRPVCTIRSTLSLVVALAAMRPVAAATGPTSMSRGADFAADSEADPPDEPDAPLRSRYPATLSAAWGYNSLEGLGIRFGYQVASHFAVDSGLGLSLAGFTYGTQARINLWDTELTPFVAAGGHIHLSSETEYLDEDGFFIAQGHPSAFADLAVGINYQRDDGLSATFSMGYALLLTHRPYSIVTGVPSAIGRESVAAQYGGGLSSGITLGYAF
jgi:hypothetical protein